MMNRPVEKVSVLNRKKSVKQNVQKSCTGGTNATTENAVRKIPPSASKENLSTELSVMYDGNLVETLVGEERAKQPYSTGTPSTPDYDIMKPSNGDIDFGGGNCGEFHNGLPRIVDLCLEDKKRILQLINELANCKEEKEAMTKEICTLKETLRQLQNENKLASERFTAQKEALALEVENLVTSRDNLSSDLENLQNCIEIQKNEIEKQVTSITTLKMEKRHLQKQLLEYDNRLKAATSNVDAMAERPHANEPQSKMKGDYMQPTAPSEYTNIQKTSNSIPPRVEKSRFPQSNDPKVKGCSGDAGKYFLPESISCSASTDVGFFAVRMCPDIGSGAALVVCRPSEHI